MTEQATAIERLRDVLRGGTWLTRERIRFVAFGILIASVIGFLFLVVTANGLIDRQGRPLGTDFSNVYAAGTYVLDSRPEAPFDLKSQYSREQQIFGQATPFYGWHYPPFFLFVAGALALMPYGIALAVWQALTLGLYLLVMRAIIAPLVRAAPNVANAITADALLLVLAFPAVLINVGHGQNGFLTAALLGGALIALQHRPMMAGFLFGLLAYKPQFGLLIPVVLIATGRWRTFGTAAATVVALALATTFVFGPHVWPAFLDSTRFTREVALEQGDTGWYKIQSLFAWARMWGAPVSAAYALQGAMVIALVAALVRLWRSGAPYALKAAALCIATILATPYTFDYDLMVLAPAIGFMAIDGYARGFGPFEKTTLALLWLMPLVARSIAHVTFIPIGVPLMIAAFVLLLQRSTIRFVFPIASPRPFLLK